MRDRERRRLAGLAASLFVALLASAACDGPLVEGGSARPPNILLIVVDTLRADHLGCYGYERPTSPHVDALASQGIRFDRAYAPAPWTKPSVASMLTGLYPGSHGVVRMRHLLPESRDTLAERLSRAGYATAGVISHQIIGRGSHFAQGFDRFLEDQARGHTYVSSRHVTAEAIGLLEWLAGRGQPFFLFVHYFDPHYNYVRHPEYGFSGERPPRVDWTHGIDALRRLDPPATGDEVDFLVAAYDEEIRFTDQAIGDLLAGIEQRGLADDTLVVFAADHGEEFFERGRLGHSTTLYEELVRVPLIVRLPGRAGAGRVVTEPVSLVALTPTLLEISGGDFAPDDFQEGSLLPLLRGDERARPSPVYAELYYRRGVDEKFLREWGSARKAALVQGRFKLIYDEPNDRYELYDLVDDPREQRDLAERRRDIVNVLRPLLKTRMAIAHPDGPTPERPEFSGDEKEMLRALGYLEGAEE